MARLGVRDERWGKLGRILPLEALGFLEVRPKIHVPESPTYVSILDVQSRHQWTQTLQKHALAGNARLAFSTSLCQNSIMCNLQQQIETGRIATTALVHNLMGLISADYN